jgi:hypothetical protein
MGNYEPSDKPTLLDKYEYAMHGKVYKVVAEDSKWYVLAKWVR